jgi:hypothetical protein
MKGTKILVLLLVVAMAAITVASPILGRNGGVGNASDEQIGCAGTSKHSASTGATVAMGGSPLSPAPGQTVTVWVNVTGGTVGRFLGVILSPSLATNNINLTADGWANVRDPIGTAFDYNEKVITGTVNSYIWTLSAPASGTHVLYAKAFYPGPSSTTFTQGLSFTVGSGTAPTATITAPTAGSTQSGTAMTVSATVTAGSAALSSVTLTVNGVTISPTQTVTSPSWTVDTTAFPNGVATLVVTATSTVGSGQTTASVTFTNPGPTVTINSPAAGSTVSGTVTVGITAAPLTGSTLGSVTLRVDSGTPVTVPAPYSYSLDTTGLTNGAHTLTVNATDNLGRSGTSNQSVTVANTGPTVAITAPADGSSVVGNVTVNATVTLGTASSPISQVVLSVDGTAVQTKTAAPYSFILDTGTYTNGLHTITVRATDAASSSGFHTISVSVSNGPVVQVPPAVNITFPTAGLILTGTVTVNATVTAGTNPVNLVTLAVDGTVAANRTALPFDFTLDPANYIAGAHTINVTAYDTVDQLGSQTVSVTFGNQTTTAPSLAPLNIVTQNGSVLVSASATGTVSYVTLSVDGAQVSNATSAPYTFTVNTAGLVPGQHTVNVTAVGPGGVSSQVSTFAVSSPTPPQPTTDLSKWQATIIGGSLFLIGAVAFLVASVLMLRRLKMRRMM